MFGTFRARVPRPEPALVPLTLHDLPPFGSPLALREHLAHHPRLAWRVEGEDEYVLGGYWRRRPEIGLVEEMVARRHREALLGRLLETYRAEGASLVVLSPHEQEAALAFYQQQGFRQVDEVVCYERRGCQMPNESAGAAAVRPYVSADLEAVLAVERAAFPWIWWNSAAELAWYSELEGVALGVALWEERVVGYTGFTVYAREGHLDRLAVHPAFQRRGLSRALVRFALAQMERQRVARVGLSTQADNYPAQALYEKLGFQKTSRRYGIWGLYL